LVWCEWNDGGLVDIQSLAIRIGKLNAFAARGQDSLEFLYGGWPMLRKPKAIDGVPI
jgi:hypothetical protein